MADCDDPGNASSEELAKVAVSLERTFLESGDRMLRWFRYDDLTPDLQDVASCFASVAIYCVTKLPATAERTVALRKLLEAKTAALRARTE